MNYSGAHLDKSCIFKNREKRGGRFLPDYIFEGFIFECLTLPDLPD